MIVRKTTPEEGRRVNELFAIAFEQPLENGPADPENDRICHWAAFENNNRDMMSTLSVTEFQIQFDGHSCRMGGMGGAASLPQYRRRGGIRGCFEAALPDMYRNGFDFSYLYPFSTAYYRKYGYECGVQTFHADVHLGLLNPPRWTGSFCLAESGNPMTEAIRAIDAQWESHYNLMVIHGPEDYRWTEKADPAVKQEFTYVCFAADGTPNAYTTFRLANQPDGRNLVCSRFCFVDREGFAGLMNLFKSLSSDHMFVKFTVPAVTAIQYLTPEWSMGAARWSLQAAGMVRVINVRSVLEKARYLGTGAAKLRIRDAQIPENDRTFAVEFAEGRAVSVTETEEAPDATLSAATFSALISGVSGLDAAVQWMNGLEIHNPASPLDRIFYQKPLFLVDYF